jgi:F0F1-type ATP synthase membrane subunit c/vacuolar-type H+-ATPase subunit K
MISKDFKNNSYYLTVTILGIALVESAAIYGLLMSLQLLNSTDTSQL